MSSIELTHRDNICICLVHSDVVFLGPIQADVRPELETIMLISEFLPICHEHLKVGDSVRQDRR